jgi:hypothetical protein
MIVVLVTWVPVDTAPPCTQCALGGDAAGVVTWIAGDWAE